MGHPALEDLVFPYLQCRILCDDAMMHWWLSVAQFARGTLTALGRGGFGLVVVRWRDFPEKGDGVVFLQVTARGRAIWAAPRLSDFGAFWRENASSCVLLSLICGNRHRWFVIAIADL